MGAAASAIEAAANNVNQEANQSLDSPRAATPSHNDTSNNVVITIDRAITSSAVFEHARIQLPASIVTSLLTAPLLVQSLAPADQQTAAGEHTAAEARVIIDTPGSALCLLDLPPEIRNSIFGFLLCEGDFIRLKTYKNTTSHPQGKIVRCTFTRKWYPRVTMDGKKCELNTDTGKWDGQVPSAFAFLQTSRSIYEEAGQLAYGSNIFHPNSRPALEQFLRVIGKKQRQWLRALHLPSEGFETRVWMRAVHNPYFDEMKLDSLVFDLACVYWQTAGTPQDRTEAEATLEARLMLHGLEPFLKKQIGESCSEADVARLTTMVKLVRTDSYMCMSCRWAYLTSRRNRRSSEHRCVGSYSKWRAFVEALVCRLETSVPTAIDNILKEKNISFPANDRTGRQQCSPEL